MSRTPTAFIELLAEAFGRCPEGRICPATFGGLHPFRRAGAPRLLREQIDV